MWGRDAAVQWFTGMNAHDVDAALRGFAADARYFGVEWREGRMIRKLYEGKDAVRAYLGAFLDSLESLEYTVERVGVDGETSVLVEWTDRGLSKSGGVYENRGVLVFDLDERGAVREARSYFDFEPVTTQQFVEDE